MSETVNHRVQVFDDQGHYVDQFRQHTKLDHHFSARYGLSIYSDGNIIDANYKSNRSFRSMVIHCTQHGNYFIELDCGTDCKKVFDKQGKFLYKFGQRGLETESLIALSTCLWTDQDTCWFVMDSCWNHRGRVFKLNGGFVTKFRASGAEEGKLNKLISTAVLSDSRITVTDFLNH